MERELVVNTEELRVYASEQGLHAETTTGVQEYWWFEIVTRYERTKGFSITAFQKKSLAVISDELIEACNQRAFLPYRWTKRTEGLLGNRIFYVKEAKSVYPLADEVGATAEAGRHAFAVTCLEALGRAWSLRGSSFDRAVGYLWSAFDRPGRLDLWEAGFSQGAYDVENELSTFDYLTPWQQKLLLLMLEEVPEILCANLYAAYSPMASVCSTQRVALLLEAARVTVPDFAPFARATRREHGHLGLAVGRGFFPA